MRKRFFVSGLVIVALVALCAFALRSKAIKSDAPITVQTPQATVRVFNNTVDNKWINVPIEITNLGANNYRVTNKTSMGIRRLIIALYAASIGKPAHGPGAHRHFVPVRITDKPIPTGKWIEVNIDQHLKEFASSEHDHAADMNRIEMLPYVIDFADEHSNKRWMGGKYIRATASNGWEEDPDLNPKKNKNAQQPNLPPQSCYVHDFPQLAGCLGCTSGNATCDEGACKKPVLRFLRDSGGFRLALTCFRCVLLNAQNQCDLFGIQCAKDDGSPCSVMVQDLDFNDPC
jgi:hypothetical protein